MRTSFLIHHFLLLQIRSAFRKNYKVSNVMKFTFPFIYFLYIYSEGKGKKGKDDKRGNATLYLSIFRLHSLEKGFGLHISSFHSFPYKC